MKQLPMLFLLLLTFSYPSYAQDAQLKEESIEVFTKLLKSEDMARKFVNDIDFYTKRSPWALSTTLTVARRLVVQDFITSQILEMFYSCGDAAAAIDADDEGFANIVLRVAALDSNKEVYIHLAVLERYGVPVYGLLGYAIGQSTERTKQLAWQGRIKGKAAREALIFMFNKEYKGIAKKVAEKRKG